MRNRDDCSICGVEIRRGGVYCQACAKNQTPPKKEIITSFRVSRELWKKAKIEVIKRDTTLTAFVSHAIERELGLKRGD